MYLILTLASQDLLRAALIHGGCVILKLARPGDCSQAIHVHIDAECAEHRNRLRATLADITGELTLDPHEAGFFNQAKIFIEDLANGRIDTGIPRPESEPAHSPTATLAPMTNAPCARSAAKAVAPRSPPGPSSTCTPVQMDRGS